MPYSLEPDEDNMPARPALPALPNTGGYTGPQQRQGFTAPIPGGQLPAPQPASTAPVYGGLSGAPTSPSPAAPPLGAVPEVTPESGALGIDEQTRQEILKDMRSAPDPEVFKTQFEQVMEQRQLYSGPKGVDERGYHVASDDQEKYYKKWVSGLYNHLTVPTEFGGQGMGVGQAKMTVIATARNKFPNIPPAAWGTYLQTATHVPDGGVGGSVSLGGGGEGQKAVQVEVGPQRAAKLDPAKITDILVTPQFKQAVEWANEYKARAGTEASAVGFVEDVYSRTLGVVKAKQKEPERLLAEKEASLERYKAFATEKYNSLPPEKQPEYKAALAEKYAALTAEIKTLKLQAKTAKAKAVSATDVANGIAEQAEILSVAAALSNLY